MVLLPIRLFLICALMLHTSVLARADDSHDLLTRVRTTISGRLPLLAEGTLQTQYKGDLATIPIRCCRPASGGSDAETWAYQPQPQKNVPPFLVVLPNELIDPLEPVIATAPASGNGSAPSAPGATKSAGALRVLNKEQIDGDTYDVVEITEMPAQINRLMVFMYPPIGGRITVKSLVRKLYIGHDGLVHRISGDVSWTASDNATGGKGTPDDAPLQKAQFMLNVTTYRKAVTFAPRPDSQPPTQSVALKPDGDKWPPLFTLSQDGRLLAQASPEGDIHLVDVKTSQEKRVLKGHLGQLTALAFSPDAKRLVSADSLVTAVWNLETGQLLYTLHDLPNVVDFTFAPDGKSVLARDHSGLTQLREMATGQKLHSLGGLPQCRFTFSPDGAYLAAASDIQVMLWNTKTWQRIEVESNGFVTSGRIAFSPDSTRLALGGYYGTVTVWDARRGRKLQELKGPGRVGAVWFSSDGRTITALDMDQRGDIPDDRTGLTTWDTASWQMIGSLSLNGGKPIQQNGDGSPGNTFISGNWLGQLDDSKHHIMFWPLPLLPARR